MKISGGMICYNEVVLVRISVLNMLKFVDQLIVCDGDSTDGTLEILREMEKEHPKLTIFSRKQETIRDRTLETSHLYQDGFNEVERRNVCLDESDGEYIIFKDIDELFADDLSVHKIVEEYPKAKLFSHILYDLVYPDKVITNHMEVRCHNTPRLVKKNLVRYRRFHEHTDIDCALYSAIQPRRIAKSAFCDVPGKYVIWHYKRIFNESQHDTWKTHPLKIVDGFPAEHDQFIKTGLSYIRRGPT